MATEKQEYSQIRLTKKRSSQTVDELCSLVPPTTFRSLRPPYFTEVIIIDDDEEEETLEAKEKKPKLGSWWDEVDAFNELSSVAKGLPKSKDAASIVDSSFSSTSLRETRKKEKDERSLSSSHHDNFTDLCEDKSYCDSNHKGNQDSMGYGHVSLEDLGVAVEDLKSMHMPWEAFDPTWEIRSETMDPWLGGYIKDMLSPHH